MCCCVWTKVAVRVRVCVPRHLREELDVVHVDDLHDVVVEGGSKDGSKRTQLGVVGFTLTQSKHI